MLFLSNRGGGISWRFDNEWREQENRVVVGCEGIANETSVK